MEGVITKRWSAVNDDGLRVVDKTVDFLQNEFCPFGDEYPMWSTDYFRWKLGSINPAGKGYISLAMLNDRVVGTVSLTKKRLLIDGSECIGGEVGDTYSSAEIRHSVLPGDLSVSDSNPDSYINKSIFGRLASDVRMRAESDGLSVIYGTPNSNAYPGWVNKLGYFDFEEYSNRSFSRPTSELFFRRYPALKFVNTALRNMEISLTSLHQTVSRGMFGRNLDFEMSIPSDDELDDLWTRNKPSKGFSLVRDATYWNYRYVEHPLSEYAFFSIRKKRSLVGVMVTRFFTGGGRRIVNIAEWMHDCHIPFSYLLISVIDYYMDAGVDQFNLWTGFSTREGRTALRSFFFPRERIPIIFADTPSARQLRCRPSDIRFYLGSSDNV